VCCALIGNFANKVVCFSRIVLHPIAQSHVKPWSMREHDTIWVRLFLPFVSVSWDWYCCNLSGGVALIVWFTTNGMCAKNKNICMWREQAIIEWSRRVISIVACCHSAKLCAHAARDFRSQQYKTPAKNLNKFSASFSFWPLRPHSGCASARGTWRPWL